MQTNKEVIAANKGKFIELLQSTGRKGVDKVITVLEETGFFEAPASTRFHLSYEGGLLEHSLGVCRIALMVRKQVLLVRPELESQLSTESVIMTTLLHDVCKAEIYKRAIKRRKNEQGFWEDYEGYDVDYSNFPVGHGEKSVIVLLQAGLELTKEEILAIRWHMSAWDLPFQSYELMGSLNAAREKTPLIGILQAADGLAANVLETTK
ncbi:MAG: HD domain-containing protein [Bacteroidaceae bacterium]|nr:HD domain-containing protein [Bacteroidaceae bacterium]